MKFKTVALIFLASVSLTACMTPQQRYDRDFSLAKQNFAEQNYRMAFQRIQLPAKAGNADAQYALGYMYYYGQGTVVNRKLANYWFQQAAQQGQPAAQKVLQMMQKTDDAKAEQ